jgi:hypothetical protein
MIDDILNLINAARNDRVISNEQAALAIYVLKELTDEVQAIAANRLVHCGSDPALLELLLKGRISPHIMKAHRQGPGDLEGEERDEWLLYASQSLGEEGIELTPEEKYHQTEKALHWLRTATNEQKRVAIDKTLYKIQNLDYERVEVGGVEMRVYTDDLGHAAAYWSGHVCAAVKQGALTFVGCTSDHTLEDLGIEVPENGKRGPCFGIFGIPGGE